jgi:hypothetical protein
MRLDRTYGLWVLTRSLNDIHLTVARFGSWHLLCLLTHSRVDAVHRSVPRTLNITSHFPATLGYELCKGGTFTLAVLYAGLKTKVPPPNLNTTLARHDPRSFRAHLKPPNWTF